MSSFSLEAWQQVARSNVSTLSIWLEATMDRRRHVTLQFPSDNKNPRGGRGFQQETHLLL